MSTDAELMAGSVEDQVGFAGVFDRHYEAIARFLSPRVGRVLAEELASETFIQAFAQRHHYDLAYPDAAPWLYGIANNLLGKHAREEDRRRWAYARAVGPPQRTTRSNQLRIASMPRSRRQAQKHCDQEVLSVSNDIDLDMVRALHPENDEGGDAGREQARADLLNAINAAGGISRPVQAPRRLRLTALGSAATALVAGLIVAILLMTATPATTPA